MTKWTPAATNAAGGFFTVVVTPPGGAPIDATTIRGAYTRITNYTSADPFGWATATIEFPMFTGFDDPNGEMGQYIRDEAKVDIYWFPAASSAYASGHYVVAPPASPCVINPLTQVVDKYPGEPVILWSGHMASIEIQPDGNGVQVQCQGALFQADGRLAKPWYPPRPWALEQLIFYYLNPTNFPELGWSAPPKITFPAGWSQVGPSGPVTVYTPYGVTAGKNYTGYSSRSTGSWNKVLTGFIADLLGVMWTQEESGVVPGNQWTILPQGFMSPSYMRNARPELHVRDRNRTADFSVWYGSPGVDLQPIRDTTSISNVIYGSGTGFDGSEWSNASVNNDGSMTSYVPLAADPRIYPRDEGYDRTVFVHEEMFKYPSGVALDQALSAASKSLPRDSDAGWTSEMTLKIDPEGLTSRYHIRAGMVVNVKGLLGTGEAGMNFHIAQVSVNPEELTVSMSLDTRFRDLLNLEEALARTRDVMTPAKMLQVNRKSVLVEDIMAPWNYLAGSGFVPKPSMKFHRSRPVATAFPWESWAKKYPPKGSGAKYYVKVNARNSKSKKRWSARVPVLLSQKGTIRRTEFACFDKDGNLLKIPFHVSVYYLPVTVQDMPHQGSNFDPFTTGFFETIQDNGQPKAANDFTTPDPSLIIGWGNKDQPAGYSPGRFSDGAEPTGVLVDDAAWAFDMLKNPDFDPNLALGKKEPTSAITAYVMIYAKASEDAYFLGRFYRQEPGT